MSHHHAARVARQAPGRFRGNARAIFEDGLARLIGIRESRGIDVDDDLIALSRSAGIDAVVEGRLREQRQRVRLPLRHRRRFRGNVFVLGARLLIQGLARRIERLHEQRADLGRQPPSHGHHTVFILIHMKRPARVLPRGLASFGDPVHASPAANYPLDVSGGAGPADFQELLFGLRRRNARQRSRLGVGQLAASERMGQQRQRPERARNPHTLARGAEVEPYTPAQPGGARAEARVLAASGVELSDEIEETSSRGVEVRRQLGDLVAQLIQRGHLHGESPFRMDDSTPEFWRHLGGATSGDCGSNDFFGDEPTQGSIVGFLWAAGPAFTRHCRHADGAHSETCQAEPQVTS